MHMQKLWLAGLLQVAEYAFYALLMEVLMLSIGKNVAEQCSVVECWPTVV